MSGFRVKPGRETSILTAVIAAAMGLFGIFVLAPAFSAGPAFGPVGNAASFFVLIWVLAAFGIAAFYAYNAFSQRGASLIDVEMQDDVLMTTGLHGAGKRTDSDTTGDFESRLRSLEALKRDGLISEAEYEEKRAAILDESW